MKVKIRHFNGKEVGYKNVKEVGEIRNSEGEIRLAFSDGRPLKRFGKNAKIVYAGE